MMLSKAHFNKFTKLRMSDSIEKKALVVVHVDQKCAEINEAPQDCIAAIVRRVQQVLESEPEREVYLLGTATDRDHEVFLEALRPFLDRIRYLPLEAVEHSMSNRLAKQFLSCKRRLLNDCIEEAEVIGTSKHACVPDLTALLNGRAPLNGLFLYYRDNWEREFTGGIHKFQRLMKAVINATITDELTF